jgi:hypothetical protein
MIIKDLTRVQELSDLMSGREWLNDAEHRLMLDELNQE